MGRCFHNVWSLAHWMTPDCYNLCQLNSADLYFFPSSSSVYGQDFVSAYDYLLLPVVNSNHKPLPNPEHISSQFPAFLPAIYRADPHFSSWLQILPFSTPGHFASQALDAQLYETSFIKFILGNNNLSLKYISQLSYLYHLKLRVTAHMLPVQQSNSNWSLDWERRPGTGAANRHTGAATRSSQSVIHCQ